MYIYISCTYAIEWQSVKKIANNIISQMIMGQPGALEFSTAALQPPYVPTLECIMHKPRFMYFNFVWLCVFDGEIRRDV